MEQIGRKKFPNPAGQLSAEADGMFVGDVHANNASPLLVRGDIPYAGSVFVEILVQGIFRSPALGPGAAGHYIATSSGAANGNGDGTYNVSSFNFNASLGGINISVPPAVVVDGQWVVELQVNNPGQEVDFFVRVKTKIRT